MPFGSAALPYVKVIEVGMSEKKSNASRAEMRRGLQEISHMKLSSASALEAFYEARDQNPVPGVLSQFLSGARAESAKAYGIENYENNIPALPGTEDVEAITSAAVGGEETVEAGDDEEDEDDNEKVADVPGLPVDMETFQPSPEFQVSKEQFEKALKTVYRPFFYFPYFTFPAAGALYMAKAPETLEDTHDFGKASGLAKYESSYSRKKGKGPAGA